jgi:hypothetical protein
MIAKVPPSFIFPLLLLVACTREGTYDFPEEPSKLVVSAHAVPGERMTVYVGYSLPYYEMDTIKADFKPRVSLTSESLGSIVLTPIGTYPNLYYITNKAIGAGSNLMLKIESPDYETVTSTTRATNILSPVETTLDRTTLASTVLDSSKSLFRVPLKIRIPDLAKSDSLFAFRLTYSRTNQELNGQLLTKEGPAQFVADGTTLANLYSISDGAILIDRKHWGNSQDSSITIEALLPYETLRLVSIEMMVEWRTLSPDYYKYYLSVARSGGLTIPFGSTDIIYNNIIGGYGNFSGYSRETHTISVR